MKINITDKPDETVQLCIDCTYSELAYLQLLLDTGPGRPGSRRPRATDISIISEAFRRFEILAKAINEHFNKED